MLGAVSFGIVLVVFLAANDACVTTETMTLSWTNSAASAASRSNFPSANRYSMTMFRPST
jgi:hypothetical protein